MDIMTHAKFYFNRLMLTLIFAIRASEPPPPRAWRTTEKVGPDRVKHDLVEFKVQCLKVFCYHGHKSTILLFIQFLKQLLTFL